MKIFDVVNVYGLLFAVILAVPHFVYARSHTYDMSVFDNRAMLYIDRIGRYGSLFLMAVNLGVLEEGFTSDLMKNFWLASTFVMTAIYILLWILFFKKERKWVAYSLTAISALIVILSGLLQVKTLLLTAGIIYLIGELYINKKVFSRWGKNEHSNVVKTERIGKIYLWK